MTAKDYPVTTPFGHVNGYPLNNGFHNGVDYGCPAGTPVVVNGVTIGLSGNTGYSTGAHLHVGRWIGGQVTDPGVGGGFNFQNAVVTQISSDATNGNYVRIQGDGASWVYLHLSEQLVNVGQQLVQTQEEEVSKTDIDIEHILAFAIGGRDGQDGRPNALSGSTDADLNTHVGAETNSEVWNWYTSDEGKNYRDKIIPGVYAERDQLRQQVQDLNKQVEELKNAQNTPPTPAPVPPAPVEPAPPTPPVETPAPAVVSSPNDLPMPGPVTPVVPVPGTVITPSVPPAVPVTVVSKSVLGQLIDLLLGFIKRIFK